MNQQILFIHGGETFSTHEEYLFWLKNESQFDPDRAQKRARRWHRQLESVLPGWTVLRPQMPNDVNAQYPEWEIYFKKVTPFLKNGVVVIGHSLGGTFLLKYLATHTLPVTVRSVYLVAPSFGVPHTTFDVFEDISKVTKHAPCTIYHSLDDSIVPFAESEGGVKRMPGARLVQFSDRGHFLSESFPELVSDLLQIKTTQSCA